MRTARGLMKRGGIGHPLENKPVAGPCDVHLDALGPAQTAWPFVAKVGDGDRAHHRGIATLESSLANQKRSHDVSASAPVARAGAASRVSAQPASAASVRTCRRP